MSKPTVKAVFFDIDGTLLSFATQRIPASAEHAIAKLKDRGIKVIVSTGRSIHSIASVRYLDFDGFITFNGSYCLSKDEQVLQCITMDPEDIGRLIAYARTTSLCFSLMSAKETTIYRPSPEITGMYTLLQLPIPPSMDLDTLDTTAVLQANVFIAPDQEADFMRTIMPNSLSSRWSPVFADVNPKGQSKKTGMEVLCAHFGIDAGDTMAFGDGGNDIEMLKYAQTGIAMGNANTSVREIADYVTDAVDNDGIWNALTHFKVI